MIPKVKICGITNFQDALYSIWCGADALGFVFYRKSKRYIDPSEAKRIIDILPPWVFKIGLFVNEDIPKVRKIAQQCGLDFIQLHGDEKQPYLKKLRGLRLIKAVRIKEKINPRALDELECELLLFDTYSKKFGGSGKRFNWRLNRDIRLLRKPYIISGGLTPSNVNKAVRMFSPYAVDVSSGVEKDSGNKDKKKLKKFIENAKR